MREFSSCLIGFKIRYNNYQNKCNEDAIKDTVRPVYFHTLRTKTIVM